MSEQKRNTKRGLTRGKTSDEAFLNGLDYIDPIQKSSTWLHKQLIKIIHRTDAVMTWYRGETDSVPDGTLLSDLVDTSGNTLCDRLQYYSECLRRYSPDNIPTEIVAIDYRCACILFGRFARCRPSVASIRAYHHALEDTWGFLLSPSTARLSQDEYNDGVKAAIRALVQAFRQLSDSFAEKEAQLKDPPSPAPAPVTKTEVKAIVEAEGKATQQEVKAIVEKDGEATRKKVHREANVVKAHVTECTEGTYKGCHHPRAKMDAAVQEVVKYLAKPGNDGSIKNACRHAIKLHSAKLNTLYDWCRVHQDQIEKDAEILSAKSC